MRYGEKEKPRNNHYEYRNREKGDTEADSQIQDSAVQEDAFSRGIEKQDLSAYAVQDTGVYQGSIA